jgi:hypothetical protein
MVFAVLLFKRYSKGFWPQTTTDGHLMRTTKKRECISYSFCSVQGVGSLKNKEKGSDQQRLHIFTLA